MADAPASKSSIDLSQAGPLPLFDQQLKVLSDAYISFFSERLRIEEQYAESLQRLHIKWKAIDSVLDDRTPSTAKKAWREVRDNVDREADTRSAFAEVLRRDVIAPLTSLKETQERTRKRVKEDIKESMSAYQSYAENDLPKLKRQYLKKCQDVEDYKSAPQGSSNTTMPQSSGATESSAPVYQKPYTQQITSPIPLRPPHRQPSLSQPNTRARSPSTSNSLQDLAHQGKKQLNQIISFLGEGKAGATTREVLGGRPDGALRGVRAKREADEADKEYRKAVHWLETLRLNRIKILEGGYKSLEIFAHECSYVMRKVLENYTSNLIAIARTAAQLGAHVTEAVAAISPDKDVISISAQTPRSMALATPKRTLYYNYHVGECNDLIFGVSLVDYATSRGLMDGELPKLVRLCIHEIQTRGLESEGIYRISGRHASVQDLTHRIERDERRFAFNPLTDDVYCISSVLKLYLRELPEPVFKFPLEDRVKHTEEREEQISSNFRTLRSKMRRIPPVHQATLKAIVEHLARVAARADKNKMDAKNLAIVFSAVIFGEDELPKPSDILSVQAWKDSVMEDMITFAGQLFDDQGTHQSPLPPAPAGELPARYDYGSSYTQVATIPPKERVASGSRSQDFTPQLPPRPSDSIHPSRRTARVTSNDDDAMPPPPLPSRPLQKQDSSLGDTGGSIASYSVESFGRPGQEPDEASSYDARLSHRQSISSDMFASPILPETPKTTNALLPSPAASPPRSHESV
ncbi:RhoGAP-domain-containing protein [Sistotremastrum niveocremeum HHB9708]|uniref:RhoGAP-domain-containing protein n=1 Tax=Sistotremastrum niveocremeum HHB9708 TaxID=1314777 RepID=A0A164UHT5_9AGAM|nr:RhoGAP-domain-containing protein [Sistotremastrum niveocremeum HHB9708]